jgi:hypothetical protein
MRKYEWLAPLTGVGLTPIGFVSFLASGIWILIVSVLLTLQARALTQPPPPGAPDRAAPAP